MYIPGIQAPYTRVPTDGFPMQCKNATHIHPIKIALNLLSMYLLKVTTHIAIKKIANIAIPGYPIPIAALDNELCALIAPKCAL